MSIRTDLALEKHELNNKLPINGVNISSKQNEDCTATIIEITSDEGEKILEKPKGKYITLEMDCFPNSSALCDGRLDLLEDMLSLLIPDSGTVLTVGLGNIKITPDAIGPLCAEGIIATRHITSTAKKELKLPPLRNVCVFSPSVTGKTGIETVEIIAGISEKIKPCAIIIIDALAARSVKRLGTTIQLSSTGIQPGSGVGNKRKALNENTLGAPVISVGIPTVVDASTLCYDLTGQIPKSKEYSELFVTPKETDIIVNAGARLISTALNCVLQKNLSKEEIISLSLP